MSHLASVTSPVAAALPEGRRPILLGRVDYRVRAVHQDSGVELFNVSYSRLSLLDSSLKLPTFGDTHALDAGMGRFPHYCF